MTDRRYPDRLGPTQPRRAVALTDRGLEEVFVLGRRRLTLWSQVRGVRWLRHGVAEVQRVNGRPIRLPHRLPQIDELVSAIEERAAATQAQWRDEGVPHDLISEWLGVRPGQRWVDDPAPSTLAAGALIALLGLLMLPAGGAPLLLGVLAIAAGLVTLHSGASGRLAVVSADGHGVTCVHGDDSWHLAWHDLTAVDAQPSEIRGSQLVVTLTAGDETHILIGAAGKYAALAHAAHRVAQTNSAAFDEAGEEPIPDTALSPTRLDEGESARGLSQVDP